MGELSIYNTLTKKKMVFHPLEPAKVKMYVCGPTVYGLLHVGNFRGAIFFNLVRNWLEAQGMQVTYVYNYTDVDDKIIAKAQSENLSSQVISERYIAEFEKDFKRLGLRKHEHNPRVTEFIPQIINFISELVKKEKAYVVDGEVFYDLATFPSYGKLSGKKLDELEAGHRVVVDQKKKGPADFVLWKPSKPGEPSWDSPWGKGRPGWHIECSAMIYEILGPTIDIHGGGIDLIFPHHENEIAQSEGRTGVPYCQCWMHNNFINMNDEKMSKSLGNIVTARKFMDDYNPEILKYLILSVYYRAQVSFNDEKITQTIAGLARIYSALRDAEKVACAAGPDNAKLAAPELVKAMQVADGKIAEALNDDFNTVEMTAQIFEIVRLFNAMTPVKKAKDVHVQASARIFLEWVRRHGQLMSLFGENPAEFLRGLDRILLLKKGIDETTVDNLVIQRQLARSKKDFQKSDEIRQQLSAMEITILDQPDGSTSWEVKKT
ncbi:MAG: cysteine--tRNA ligase [Bdellovibrionales bacterium GWA2_49_15]|nr:MAG: cysteine--tRNA ligase [Bdellovibrionales bacterium GWA2_49_15]HAZ12001.1 cysteine--tRNA ligase [Bdellovibrionales bacterium]